MVELTPGPAEQRDAPEGIGSLELGGLEWEPDSVIAAHREDQLRAVIRHFQLYVRATYESYGWDPETHWIFRVYPDMTAGD